MNIAKPIPGPEGRRSHALEPQTVRLFTHGFHIDLANSVEARAACVLGRVGDVDRGEIALLRLRFDVTFQLREYPPSLGSVGAFAHGRCS
jgi:hypothetical protein